MILPAQTIRAERPVFPIHNRTVAFGKSFGISAAGYDVRIRETTWMWPGRFVLASTIERFDIPDDVAGVIWNKSTLMRRGLFLIPGVLEPGWEGYLTLEMKMFALRPLRLRAGSPIAQIVFHRLEAPTQQAYVGKYQDQRQGPQKAILEDASV